MPLTAGTRENHKLDLATEILRSGGTIRLRALGTSMLPSIWPGDFLSIESNPGNAIVPGDIVLVVHDRRFFIHRLIEKHNGRCITRGDSLPQNDAPVTEAQVLGKVSAIHRATGVVAPGSRTPVRAWVLCHWNSFRNIAVRIHSFRQCGILLATTGKVPALQQS